MTALLIITALCVATLACLGAFGAIKEMIE